MWPWRSDFREACPRHASPLHGLLDALRDDEGDRPTPGPEELDIPHLAWVDPQTDHLVVLPHPFLVSILGGAITHLFTSRIVDTPDRSEQVHDVVPVRMAVDRDGKELQLIVEAKLLEERLDPVVDG